MRALQQKRQLLTVILCTVFWCVRVVLLSPTTFRTKEPPAAPPDDVLTLHKKDQPAPWRLVQNQINKAHVNSENISSNGFNETIAFSEDATTNKTESSVAVMTHDQNTMKSATTDNTTSDSSTNANIMAFIRIPKTGSTSLLNFLMNDSQNYNSLLSNQYWISMNLRQKGMYTCMFYNSHVMNTTHRPAREPQCAHANHGELHAAFNASKQHVNIASLAPMKTFTMVREPFDRLRSFFYYMRLSVNSHQWGKPANTKKMYDQVVSGNFSKWLELLWSQYNVLDMQYEFLSRNATTAIEMMENGTVDVYVNECFNVSLRFMAQRYHMGPVDQFLENSTIVQSNNNKNDYVDLFEQEQLIKLRENAKAWFPDEYRFYNAAVRQFQWKLTSSPMSLECPVVI